MLRRSRGGESQVSCNKKMALGRMEWLTRPIIRQPRTRISSGQDKKRLFQLELLRRYVQAAAAMQPPHPAMSCDAVACHSLGLAPCCAHVERSRTCQRL